MVGPHGAGDALDACVYRGAPLAHVEAVCWWCSRARWHAPIAGPGAGRVGRGADGVVRPMPADWRRVRRGRS